MTDNEFMTDERMQQTDELVDQFADVIINASPISIAQITMAMGMVLVGTICMQEHDTGGDKNIEQPGMLMDSMKQAVLDALVSHGWGGGNVKH